jgi:hypothetical protein
MLPRKRAFVPSFGGHQSGDKRAAIGNRKNTFNGSKERALEITKL